MLHDVWLRRIMRQRVSTIDRILYDEALKSLPQMPWCRGKHTGLPTISGRDIALPLHNCGGRANFLSFLYRPNLMSPDMYAVPTFVSSTIMIL